MFYASDVSEVTYVPLVFLLCGPRDRERDGREDAREGEDSARAEGNERTCGQVCFKNNINGSWDSGRHGAGSVEDLGGISSACLTFSDLVAKHPYYENN